MEFSPGPDFYAATAQVIPLLLLALVFEARLVSRMVAALRARQAEMFEAIAEQFAQQEATEEGVLQWSAVRARAAAFLEELRAMEGESVEGVRRHTWAMRVLLGGLIVALAAEAMAVVALTMRDPPDAFAALVLLGCFLLLLALLVALLDAVAGEFRGRATEESPPSR